MLFRKYSLLKVAALIPIVILYFLFFVFRSFEYFKDRESYLFYAKDPDFFRRNYQGFEIIFNEPLFLSLNGFLGYLLNEYQVVYFILIFNGLSLFLFLFKSSKDIFSLILGSFFLITCFYSFNMQFVLLRFFLATILFLYIINFRKENILFYFILPFIHSAFFIILPLIYFYIKICVRFNKFVASLVMFFSGLFASGLYYFVGNYFGVRQVMRENLDQEEVVSGGGFFIVFSLLLLYFLYFMNRKDIYYNLAICGLSVFLGMYFTSVLSSRMMGFFIFPILFVLVSEKSMMSNLILLFLSVLFCYIAFWGETMSILVPYGFLFESFLSDVI